MLYILRYFAVMNGLFQWISMCALIIVGDAAIEPPPWSDPTKNPCANQPGGWQLLYWPPLEQCFKIYTVSNKSIVFHRFDCGIKLFLFHFIFFSSSSNIV